MTINYDGGDVTLRCLKSLHELDYPQDRVEIFVVDNGSIDGLIWVIPSLFPKVRIITSITNEGFARGNNLAMADLTGVDFIALINNDAYVEPKWLSSLVDAARSGSRIGAVTSKMLFSVSAIGFDIVPGAGSCVGIANLEINNEPNTAGIHFDERRKPCPRLGSSSRSEYWTSTRTSLWCEWSDWPLSHLSIEVCCRPAEKVRFESPYFSEAVECVPDWLPVQLPVGAPVSIINNAGGGLFDGFYGGDVGFREIDFGQYEDPREVFSFCGGSALLNVDMLREVGLFDPTFFLYYEDLDLSWRARLLGWKILYEPQSVVFHEHAFSSGENSPFFKFWVDRNRRLTLIKNAPVRVLFGAVAGSFGGAARDAARIVRVSARHPRKMVSDLKIRLRQLGSFLKAVPRAIVSRRRLTAKLVLPRSFANQWVLRR